MGTARRWFLLIAAGAAMAACTPGASSPPTGGVASGSVIVRESLLTYGQVSSAFGSIGGFKPNIIVVATGATIQFHNEDSFNHTASAIAASSFPAGNPISSAALQPSGSDVSQPGWSSGVLLPNAFSQPLATRSTGTYLFGCFYHYPLMRGVIIVQ
jgi:plastocyanin